MTRQAPFQSSRDLVEAKKELQGNQRMASHDPRIRTAGKILPLSGFPSNVECSDMELLTVFS